MVLTRTDSFSWSLIIEQHIFVEIIVLYNIMAYYYNTINITKFVTDRQLNQKLVSRYLPTYINFFKSKNLFSDQQRLCYELYYTEWKMHDCDTHEN